MAQHLQNVGEEGAALNCISDDETDSVQVCGHVAASDPYFLIQPVAVSHGSEQKEALDEVEVVDAAAGHSSSLLSNEFAVLAEPLVGGASEPVADLPWVVDHAAAPPVQTPEDVSPDLAMLRICVSYLDTDVPIIEGTAVAAEGAESDVVDVEDLEANLSNEGIFVGSNDQRANDIVVTVAVDDARIITGGGVVFVRLGKEDQEEQRVQVDEELEQHGKSKSAGCGVVTGCIDKGPAPVGLEHEADLDLTSDNELHKERELHVDLDASDEDDQGVGSVEPIFANPTDSIPEVEVEDDTGEDEEVSLAEPSLAASRESIPTIELEDDSEEDLELCVRTKAPGAEGAENQIRNEAPQSNPLRPLAWAVSKLCPTARFQQTASETLAALTALAHDVLGPEAQVRPFGSLLQSAHLEGSDLDLCVKLPTLEGQPLRDGDSQTRKADQIKALKQLMNNLTPSFRVKEARFFDRIRVPILVLEYQGSRGDMVEADISVGSFDEGTGVAKGTTDRLIRRILERTPHALPLVLLVKKWAKARGLNTAFEGFLNSLGWTLLCLFFLARRGDVEPEALSCKDDGVTPAGEATLELPTPVECDLVRAPSGAELAAFFEDTASLGLLLDTPRLPSTGPPGISLLSHSVVQGPAGERAPFYIEDPGVKLATGRDENVGRALTEGTWRTLLRCCAEAAKGLRSGRGSGTTAWASALIGLPITPASPEPRAARLPPQQRLAPASAPRPKPSCAPSRQIFRPSSLLRPMNWPVPREALIPWMRHRHGGAARTQAARETPYGLGRPSSAPPSIMHSPAARWQSHAHAQGHMQAPWPRKRTWPGPQDIGRRQRRAPASRQKCVGRGDWRED